MSKYIDCKCGERVEKRYCCYMDEDKELVRTKYIHTCNACGQQFVEPAKPVIDLG